MKKKVFLVLTGILILALACYLVSALMVGGEQDLSSALNGQIEELFLDPERVEWQEFSYLPKNMTIAQLESFELDGEKIENLMAYLSSVTVKKSVSEGGISEFACLLGTHTDENGNSCTVSVMFSRASENKLSLSVSAQKHTREDFYNITSGEYPDFDSLFAGE